MHKTQLQAYVVVKATHGPTLGTPHSLNHHCLYMRGQAIDASIPNLKAIVDRGGQK